MAWKAKIAEVRDVGNGTGDVSVEFYDDSQPEKRPVRRTYNFHASTTLEMGKAKILQDLKALADFDELAKVVSGLVGAELSLPEPEKVPE